jgi:hypothetical protein
MTYLLVGTLVLTYLAGALLQYLALMAYDKDNSKYPTTPALRTVMCVFWLPVTCVLAYVWFTRKVL